MSAILLSAHVIVSILAVGPIAVAASMFPRYAREEGNQAVPLGSVSHLPDLCRYRRCGSAAGHRDGGLDGCADTGVGAGLDRADGRRGRGARREHPAGSSAQPWTAPRSPGWR